MGFCTDQMLKEGFGETAGCVLQVVKCKLFVESCGISSMILFSPPWGWGGLNSSAEEGQKHFLLQPSFPLCFQQHAQSRNEMACYPLATLDSRSNKDVFQIMGYLPSYEIVPLECFTGTSHRLTTPVPLLQVPKHTSFLGLLYCFCDGTMIYPVTVSWGYAWHLPLSHRPHPHHGQALTLLLNSCQICILLLISPGTTLVRATIIFYWTN